MISGWFSYDAFLFDVTLGEIHYLFFVHYIYQTNSVLYETDLYFVASMLYFQLVFC